MVDMGVSQQDKINVARRNRQFLVLVQIRPLLHSAVDQNVFSAGFQKMTTARHLVGCADTGKSHMHTPFLFHCNMIYGAGL